MNKTSKIYIAGHRGLVGSAIVKNLKLKSDHTKEGGYKTMSYYE